jgi:hypothetical protein
MNDHQQSKTVQTRTIEERLKVGQSLSVIARSVGVSWQRVRQIKTSMENETMAANALARRIAREELKKRYKEHLNNIKAKRSSEG